MPSWRTSNPGACLVKTRLPPAVMPEVQEEAVPVVAAVVAEVVAAVVAEVVAAVVVEVMAAVVVEVLEEEVEAEVTVMGTTMTTRIPPLRIVRAHPDVDADDELTGSSMTPRCSDSWHKSCKINSKRPWVDALRISQPPTPSRRPTKTDNDPP